MGLVRAYDLITFEDLNVKGMTKNNCLAKHIADAAWSKLITITTYKAEWTGKRVELVDLRNTSQICSSCGQNSTKGLSERIHNCLSVVLFWIEIRMPLLIFSDWDYNL